MCVIYRDKFWKSTVYTRRDSKIMFTGEPKNQEIVAMLWLFLSVFYTSEKGRTILKKNFITTHWNRRQNVMFVCLFLIQHILQEKRIYFLDNLRKPISYMEDWHTFSVEDQAVCSAWRSWGLHCNCSAPCLAAWKPPEKRRKEMAQPRLDLACRP